MQFSSREVYLKYPLNYFCIDITLQMASANVGGLHTHFEIRSAYLFAHMRRNVPISIFYPYFSVKTCIYRFFVVSKLLKWSAFTGAWFWGKDDL